MDVWLNFAMIVNGKVDNIACFLFSGYTEANVIARQTYGENALAVDVTHIPVMIGDDYENGQFFRNGDIVNPFPTVEQQVNALNNAVDDLATALLEG